MAPPQDPFASFTDPVTGKPMLVPQGKAPAGVPYRVSEGIGPNGRTASGDASNAFRGYVSPDGGGFGSAKGRAGFEGISGVSADKLGDTSGYSDADWTNMNRAFSGIANRDDATIDAGLTSGNDFLKRTATAYKLGRGSEGITDDEFAKFQTGGLDALAPAPVDSRSNAAADALAAEQAANAPRPKRINADPYGRKDAATSASNVIKPGQDRMNVTDPFADFQAPPAPRPPTMTNLLAPGAGAALPPTPADAQAGVPGAVPFTGTMATEFAPEDRSTPPPPTDTAVPEGGQPITETMEGLGGFPVSTFGGSAPVGSAGGIMGTMSKVLNRAQRAKRPTGLFDRYRKMSQVAGAGRPQAPTPGLPSGGAFAL